MRTKKKLKKALDGARAAWLKTLRSPRHWRLSDVERLIEDAAEHGESPRDHAIGLGLDRSRVERWLRRYAELRAADARTSTAVASVDVDSNGERALANAFVELRAEGTPVAFHEVPIASPAVVLMHLAGGVMVEVPANGEGARFVAAVATHAASTRASCS